MYVVAQFTIRSIKYVLHVYSASLIILSLYSIYNYKKDLVQLALNLPYNTIGEIWCSLALNVPYIHVHGRQIWTVPPHTWRDLVPTVTASFLLYYKNLFYLINIYLDLCVCLLLLECWLMLSKRGTNGISMMLIRFLIREFCKKLIVQIEL